jgi:hypothetical protein
MSKPIKSQQVHLFTIISIRRKDNFIFKKKKKKPDEVLLLNTRQT